MRSRDDSRSSPLFPFLAVLVCAMGALILQGGELPLQLVSGDRVEGTEGLVEEQESRPLGQP